MAGTFADIVLQRPTTALIVGLAAVVVIRQLACVFYNLFLHPLRSFPGPRLAAASFLPQFIARGRGDVRYVKGLHDKYGTVVRLSPSELSFTSPAAWRDIYAHKPGQKQLPKQIVVDSPDLTLKAPHLILAPDEAHARMRRNLSHAFSAQAVNEQEPLMNVHFNKLIQRVTEQSAKGDVDMEKMFNCVAFDIIGDLAFGESFGALDRYAYHEYMEMVFRNLKVFSMFQRLSVYKWALGGMGMLMSVIPAATRARAKYFQFAAEQVEARMARETDRKDFMWYILQHNDKEGRGLSKQEIYSNSGLLIGAGSETTATTLTGATYYLLHYPRTLQRLTAEIRGAFSSASDITISAASRLPYLVATMDEAMRLYPPVPAANVRVTTHDTVIDGYVVPPGARVAVQQYTTHRASTNFYNSSSFVPERWLPEVGIGYKDDARGAFNPFSLGPRNCLGKNLAYAEMYAIMARIIWHFDLHQSSKEGDWLEQRTFLFWEKGPLWVKVTPRS